MHAFLEAEMGDKPALQPKAAIGPAVRAIAGISLPARARLSPIRNARAGMPCTISAAPSSNGARSCGCSSRLFPTPPVLRHEAREHARSLALARDGQSALNAFDDLVKKGVVLSERTMATIRGRIEALRASEERAGLTPELRQAIVAWLDATAAEIELWPLDPFDFSSIAARLAAGYREARQRIPADWSQASAEDLHQLRQRVVDHRYQMDLVEPLWPRQGRMWTDEAERLRDRLGRCQDLEILKQLTAPHQPLARWRSRLTPACAERTTELAHRAARIAQRLFAEKPKAFRRRLETLWEHGR